MVEGLVRALTRLRPDLEIVLVTGRHGAQDLAAAGPLVREAREAAGTVDPSFEAERLPDLVREVRPDVYHATCFVLPDLPLPCRTVVTLHDACVRRRPELVRPGLRELLDRATEVSLARADAVATVSEFSRREIAAGYGVPPGRIEVVPNGVDDAFFEASPPAPGVPERFWFFAGALEERKGLPEAIAGYAIHARRTRSAWPLLLAGSRGGGARIDPAALAREADVAGLVRPLGHVDEPTLRSLYRAASGVLYLSRYEGFGLPALEALASGAPTIATDGSALPEVVGSAALLVPERDPESVAAALDRLQGDCALTERLRLEGPPRARRFDWRAAARRYLGLYGF